MLNKLIDSFSPIDLEEMRFPGFLDKRAQEIERCVQNVNQGAGWREQSPCPVCSSYRRRNLFERFGIKVLQCMDCTVGYMEKFPVRTEDVYSDAAYIDIARSDYLENVEYRKKRFGKERIHLIQKYISKNQWRPRLLDSGCGTGWFLELARESGFEICGHELGRGLADYSAQKLKIKVWNCPLKEIEEKEGFDVVTLFDVIEHVSNPYEVMEDIFKLLKPGGIALLFTPNLDSLGFWKLKAESSLVMPAEHLFYFTKKSFRILLEKSAFHELYFATKGMDIADLYSYYADKTEKKQVADFLRGHCDVLQAVIDESGYANHMRFIVQRAK